MAMDVNFTQLWVGEGALQYLYECSVCHALVHVDGRHRHADWHRSLPR